ncbi:MAG: DUF721 domain-containing protein [Armatimonadetes bacterium]|nr:DUF721 domain-containing protein [Armatimonadota bacterium]
MKGKLQTLGSLLQGTLKRFRIERQVHESSCLVLWDRVVGGYLASITQPERFRGGILYVNTRSPSWAQELEFQKTDLIKRMNRRLGSEAVKDIHFQPKGLKRQPLMAQEFPALFETEEWQQTDLSLEDWAYVKEATVSIQDPVLKEKLETMLAHQRKQHRWREAHGWRPCAQCRVLHDTPFSKCPICRLPER